MNSKKLIFKYLLFISLMLLIFLSGRIYYDKIHQQNMMQERLLSLSTNIDNALDISKSDLVKNYTMLTTHFMNSEKLYQYFKNKQREALYTFLKKDYEDFKTIDPNLFVMHFFDKNNITILRMHKPNSYNDDLSQKRPIVAFVNKSLKAQNAFEVGKNGIVYRITSPYIYNNEHIGALEFGIRFTYFTDLLKNKFHVSNAQLVKTDHLDILIAKKQYPTLKNYSVVAHDPIFNTVMDKIDISKDKQIIEHNNKTYLVCSNNLTDYNDQIVSKIISLKDISSIVEKKNLWLQMVNTSSIIVYLLIILIIYMILNKFSNEIQNHTKTITKLNRKSKYLQNKANTDELTKIYNKRYFNNYLDKFIDSSEKGCLLFFDIDHFKNINDLHGHLVGDEILKQLAKLVRSHLRQDDLFARWGGEEFIIILNDLPFELAYKKADILRKTIEKTPLYQDITITISIGLSTIDHNESTKELIHRVDTLLYQAKENGRNCVIF